MSEIQIKTPLVETDWLRSNLNASNLVILDATLPKAVQGNTVELPQVQITGARFFDIKNEFSDVHATYPNTWPGEKAFVEAARRLGINQKSAIVVYDDHGIYSSARAWWMFRAMGHHNVAVLNGGLPAWISMGGITEPKVRSEFDEGDFDGKFNNDFIIDHKKVFKNLHDDKQLVLDARAKDRFLGVVEEPRKGLRSGHIPGSESLPYTDLLTDGTMRDAKELSSLFSKFPKKEKGLIFSCGSGITACALALGAELSGLKNISVYDGSWTEWGSMDDLPIEKG
ncbi:sulfurtransferase [Lutimonas zeaxanthinifaciens]|uniref:sulfurtransferase n=1 Tax=Lutimonas zeaxanthinifaciens TaxID=3060215 RepID=UPI00265D4BB0|nr:sulfurtransferase [Lutimonas sp. YSD2104]WKK67421.1 sulfurtransferase [Lutimonas sp. YSD2104]